MNNFTIDMAVQSKFLKSNSILRLSKQTKMLNFLKLKLNDPRLSQKQFCNQLGFSDSTIKHYRDDISMDSPYKIKKHSEKNNKPNTTLTETQTHQSNEKNKHFKSIKKNKTLKAGNPKELHMSGREILEQVFQNDKADSISENNKEDNTKFITLARKMVDNV